MAKVSSTFKKSLFYRYFAICSGVILATIVLMGALTIGFSLDYFKKTSQTALKKNAQQAVALTLSSMQEYDFKKIGTRDVLGGYRIISGTTGYTIFLTDTEGRTLLCTEGENCAHFAYSIPQDVIDQVIGGEYNKLGNLGGIYKTSHYNVGLPVEHNGTVYAMVFASWDASGLGYYVMDIMDIIFFCALIATLISSVAIYIATRNLTKPLRSMAAAARSFSNGDFSVRVPIEGEDEIAQLAMSFNHMADSLADLESVRRSFIANVSHELKTPMMTIGGFIDGILDGTVPEEKRGQYLETVSAEVKRLSRMVTSMLSIARIEAGDMKINPTNFDINEMICRTVFTFEQKIEERNLEIIGLESDEIFVQADSDLIHHVVYNLIDNAVKFANKGGCITFSYKTEDGKVFVSVRNSGDGIPQSELPRLFDRFYKTDKSRSLDKTGVGLGLYIVQTIINQHHSDLIVSSVEGEYTEFTFSIPAADPKFIKEHNKHYSKDKAEPET